jgi:hypothetical protein
LQTLEQAYTKVVGLVDAELQSFLTTASYVLYWYLSGVVFTTILCAVAIYDGKTEEIRLKDFEEYLGWALGGPLIGLIVLSILFLKATTGIRQGYSEMRHRVLWRSKSSQAKEVLFGSKDTDDD